MNLIWLMSNNDDQADVIIKLRLIVNSVKTFADIDECMDFITDIKEKNVLLIVPETCSQTVVPLIQDVLQINRLYILCENETKDQDCVHQCSNGLSIYIDFTRIHDELKQTAQVYDQNSTSLSFVKSNEIISKDNLDQLDQSFMYTQIIKEILLTIHFEQNYFDEFLTYWREQLAGSTTELVEVDRFEKEYHSDQAIRWYTSYYFLYSVLNRALRTMEVELIIKMGFFLRDLDQCIAKLHAEQYGGHHQSESFVVYRGQGLAQTDFDKLVETKGGLMSFNNFLSTSLDRTVSLMFAESSANNPDLVGVIFEITINPSVSSAFFANICGISAFAMEEEILFSMHSVFRITQIQKINENDCLWQVDIILSDDNDPQLHALTECIREETFSDYNGWDRLGLLMIKLSQFNKAEELYELLLAQTTDESEEAHLYHMLGYIKDDQGKYEEAITCYERGLAIRHKTLSPNHFELASSYNNIASVYDNMSEYSKAISYYEKTLAISKNTLYVHHPSLATAYNNIGFMYNKMGDYSKAMPYYHKALQIRQRALPSNHPDLATSYYNVANIYENMDDYLNARPLLERAVDIAQCSLPAHHLDLRRYKDKLESVQKKL